MCLHTFCSRKLSVTQLLFRQHLCTSLCPTLLLETTRINAYILCIPWATKVTCICWCKVDFKFDKVVGKTTVKLTAGSEKNPTWRHLWALPKANRIRLQQYDISCNDENEKTLLTSFILLSGAIQIIRDTFLVLFWPLPPSPMWHFMLQNIWF